MTNQLRFCSAILSVIILLFSSCSKDDDYVDPRVVIYEDGSTSNGSHFTAIDDRTFYLDDIKYYVMDGYINVAGYDEVGFKGKAKIVPYINYMYSDYEVLRIAQYAFKRCPVLTEVIIPNSIKEIGLFAFYGCRNLTSITIPSSVTSIMDGAFRGCESLETIIISEDNEKYDSRDRCNSIIETKTNNLLFGCSNSTIPNTVKRIEQEAFYGNTELSNITIPNSVTSIGSYAFSGCRGLTSITIPDSITEIDERTFYNCTGLTNITLPDSLITIRTCAFMGCKALSSITIPNSVKTIESEAFGGCSSLTSINIPDGVTTINQSTFYECSNLTSITIPNSVKTIGADAFAWCSNLTDITIPNSVTFIGEFAFYRCKNLTAIHCLSTTPPDINSYSFDADSFSKITIYVPKGTLDAYKNSYWQRFENIVEE